MPNEEWSEAKSAPRNFAKFINVGDKVVGVYVDKRIVDNKMKAGFKQTIYTLVQDNGEEIFVAANGMLNPQILPGLENLEMGLMVKVELVELREPKDKKFKANKAKILKAFTNGTKKEETLNEYRERHGLTFITDLESKATPF